MEQKRAFWMNENQFVEPNVGMNWDNIPKKDRYYVRMIWHKRWGDMSLAKAFKQTFGEKFDHTKVDWDKMFVVYDKRTEMYYYCYGNRCFVLTLERQPVIPDERNSWQLFLTTPKYPLYLYNREDHIEFSAEEE